uniref:Uncharacterized protein n=1 Tax=Fagus sylvatica TaxID=28930 RepID=A0A2N9EYM5_FAGSY
MSNTSSWRTSMSESGMSTSTSTLILGDREHEHEHTGSRRVPIWGNFDRRPVLVGFNPREGSRVPLCHPRAHRTSSTASSGPDLGQHRERVEKK